MGYGRELVAIDVYDVVVDGWLVRGNTFMTKMKQSPALIPTDNMIHFGFTINHSISFILILRIYFHLIFHPEKLVETKEKNVYKPFINIIFVTKTLRKYFIVFLPRSLIQESHFESLISHISY
jgi:hypothetical protein